MAKFLVGTSDITGLKNTRTTDQSFPSNNPYVSESYTDRLYIDFASNIPVNINSAANSSHGGYLPTTNASSNKWPSVLLGDGTVSDIFIHNNDLISGTKASGFDYIDINCWTDPAKTFALCLFEMKLSAAKTSTNVQCITGFKIDGRNMLYHTSGPAWTWPGHMSTGGLLEQNQTIWFLDNTSNNGYLKSGDCIRGYLFGPLA